jgi:hypothetical protein
MLVLRTLAAGSEMHGFEIAESILKVLTRNRIDPLSESAFKCGRYDGDGRYRPCDLWGGRVSARTPRCKAGSDERASLEIAPGTPLLAIAPAELLEAGFHGKDWASVLPVHVSRTTTVNLHAQQFEVELMSYTS